ncbi:unannotated protein [freshwater metagenome]|uniref:Unannotated protein n=1 Tax=freshwater metagenome TaxID=449393 RepID=A0A6J7LWK3_9ZZZZ
MNLNYFPGIDITENTFAQIITNITGQPFIGINLLIIASFPIAAALSYLTIRITGLRGPIAVSLAVAFSLIPYHWGRALGHTYLATLYSAIIGLALVLLIGSGKFEQLMAHRSPRRRALVLSVIAIMVVTVAWTGIYYAVFTLILGAAALLWRFAHRASGRALLIDAVPVAGVGLLSAIGFLPALLTLRADAPLASLGERTPYESVIFAGDLAIALLPLPQSSLLGFGRYNDAVLAAVADAPYGESSVITNHGTWITTAALLVFVAGIILRTRRKSDVAHGAPRLQGGARVTPGLIGYLIVVTLLFFVPWGLNFLFADLVTASIRGWNRLLPMLLLLFILGAATVLRSVPWTKRAVIAIPVAVAIIGIAGLDSALPFRGAYRTSATEAGEITAAARDYSTAVNAAIPEACGILQLPYMAYPEFGVQRGINDYDHFWTSLANPGKRWSYGAVKNTDAGVWSSQLPQVPNDNQIALLKQSGFCAIHLDTRGYVSEALPAIKDDLNGRFGAPLATGFDGRWELYGLGSGWAAPDAELSPEAYAFLHQPMITPDEFTALTRDSLLQSAWWWTTQREGMFTLTPTTPDVPVRGVSGKVRAPKCGPTPVTLTLEADGQRTSVTVAALPDADSPFELTLERPADAQAVLTVEALGAGCDAPGQGKRFAQVIDLSERMIIAADAPNANAAAMTPASVASVVFHTTMLQMPTSRSMTSDE